jgi:DNA primase
MVSASSDPIIRQIKDSVDIVSLVGQYLQVHRIGNRFKALCPFHDDRNPSLDLNPQRQSFKCWACGAGGDCIEFVKLYERVEFPEAIRILADRLGIRMPERRSEAAGHDGASVQGEFNKADLYRALDWVSGFYRETLDSEPESLEYLAGRGLHPDVVSAFGLGYSPADTGRIRTAARRAGFSEEILIACGVLAESEGRTYDRFHDRLIFPIRDSLGRTVGFGGRILPARDKLLAEQGRRVGKYLNSPETTVFRKRKLLYAADMARNPARTGHEIIVMEGYTDVMAAHQEGVGNVVGTLGTALGEEHIPSLRQLSDRVVIVFDGDEAGQKAAERCLEIFLGHPVDLAMVTLPGGADPCDFLMAHGGEAFRTALAGAKDPLNFAIDRIETRFDLRNSEQARQAVEWIMSIFSRAPRNSRDGIGVKMAMALDRLSFRLRIPVAELQREWNRHRKEATRRETRREQTNDVTHVKFVGDPDPLEREFVELLLNHPELVAEVMPRVLATELRHPTLRMIAQAIYETQRSGEYPDFSNVSERFDPEVRSYAERVLDWIDTGPLPAGVVPASGEDRLTGILAQFERRTLQTRLDDLRRALSETDPVEDPETHASIRLEIRRLLARGMPPLGSTFSKPL